MRLLFCGSSLFGEATFKRLLVLADDIAVMDRPSVSFPRWGTVGHQSPLRDWVPAFADTPVRLHAYAPPSGPAELLYLPYVEADLASEEFRRIVLDGLADDESFAGKLVQLDADYPSERRIWRGRDIVRILAGDRTLTPVSVDFESRGRLFDLGDEEGRRIALRSVLVEASIKITSAMVVAETTGFLPVADDRPFARLLALRTTRAYVGGGPVGAPFLGLEVAKAVIPDEALQRLSFEDIIKYRHAAKEPYVAWSTELNRLAVALTDVPPEKIEETVSKLIATEIAPRLQAYKVEMASVRDKLFADLLKGARWQVPSISLAYLTGLSFASAIAAFVGALPGAVPALVDYVQARRDIKRKNAMSYLIGIAEEA